MSLTTAPLSGVGLGLLALTLALVVLGCRQGPDPTANGLSGPSGPVPPATATVAPSPPPVPTRAAADGMPGPSGSDTSLRGAGVSPAPSAPTPRALSQGEHGQPFDPCGVFPPSKRQRHWHFVHWTRDGAHLVFDFDDTIWTLDIEGAALRKVADADTDDERFEYGFYADVSPEGSRIVYSTCEYLQDESHYDQDRGLWLRSDGYEIASVDLDGAGRRRLTKTWHLDHYPVWSPDGTQIAFIAAMGTLKMHFGYPAHPLFQRDVKLAIVSADVASVEGGEIKYRRDVEGGTSDWIPYVDEGAISWLESTARVALYPPAWSPDGEHLAFVAEEGDHHRPRLFLHTIRPDGSELTRIGGTTAPPRWSPDGEELAFAAADGKEVVIYADRATGAGRRVVWWSKHNDLSAPVSQVAWSPGRIGNSSSCPAWKHTSWARTAAAFAGWRELPQSTPRPCGPPGLRTGPGLPSIIRAAGSSP